MIGQKINWGKTEAKNVINPCIFRLTMGEGGGKKDRGDKK
jgi:hypothetical protein